MRRSLRIQYPEAIYHVTVRGNARQSIYTDDADRRLFYSRMEASVKHAGVRLYLFCKDKLAASRDIFTPLLHEIERHKLEPRIYRFGSSNP